MKARNDFVSNSSSSSFVVNDVLKFKQLLSAWSNNDVYDIKELKIYAYVDIKHKKQFERYSSSIHGEFNEKLSMSFSMEDFFNMPDEDISKISSIDISCDDFDRYENLMLSVLKKALEKNGINVDSSDSEQPLVLEDYKNYNGTLLVRNLFKEAF